MVDLVQVKKEGTLTLRNPPPLLPWTKFIKMSFVCFLSSLREGLKKIKKLAFDQIDFFKIHFLHSPTIHNLKTVLYLLSFEAFNDSMYSTNMVSYDCSP